MAIARGGAARGQGGLSRRRLVQTQSSTATERRCCCVIAAAWSRCRGLQASRPRRSWRKKEDWGLWRLGRDGRCTWLSSEAWAGEQLGSFRRGVGSRRGQGRGKGITRMGRGLGRPVMAWARRSDGSREVGMETEERYGERKGKTELTGGKRRPRLPCPHRG